MTYTSDELEVIAYRAALSFVVASPERRDDLLREWMEPLDALEMFEALKNINGDVLFFLDQLRRLSGADHDFDQGVEQAKSTVPPLPVGFPDPTRLEL